MAADGTASSAGACATTAGAWLQPRRHRRDRSRRSAAGLSATGGGRRPLRCAVGSVGTGSGILPSSQASKILRAIGAAVLPPKPPCSTETATAIVGFSAGA